MSGYPFEDSYGYARAIRVGDHVFASDRMTCRRLVPLLAGWKETIDDF